MTKETITLFKEIIEMAYKKSTNDKVSFYLHLMDIIDLYDENISIERKNKLKKDYDYTKQRNNVCACSGTDLREEYYENISR